ncbi:hypothetical protein CROQUDRAFT_100770 [Cronartium quercuum f. sp. fusiforme G11]|uniref:CAP-Gly domain-containing protein n=1 Tax=Cronartium quercuum f. sp. fusiforme G11 TaxID=708437 RepID=A0A9P6T5K1_9BASI|nr:hypothetical protein CROQUDRAFT_100770 [Cronartium quercuum f. sp. fusiforme G11]
MSSPSQPRKRTPIKLELPQPNSALATQASKQRWQNDLSNLLKNANARFADLAWTLAPGQKEQIWAHKAIIYARAGGQFQLKYLAAPAPPPHSRLPALPSNASSASFSPFPVSLRSVTPQSTTSARRPPSPGASSLNSLSASTRQVAVLNGTDPTLFQSILEALYTANGLSEVFSFLFDDHTAGDGPEARTDKLRRDLLYMWRSKLYSDCHIILVNGEGPEKDADGNPITEQAVFSAHRAILCSRSPYFASLLLDPYADSNKRTFTLASPPFTPASLHFSLGYLYCGTLDFSNRTFDLSTAMQIWRSAQYLGLELLKEEVEAKISDMCHNFKDNCKMCISRIGRVYAFALALDVNSKRLERLAEPYVIESFGSIWNKAIGQLHYEAQTRIVDLVCSSIDPNTIIDAIRSSKRLKERLANERSDWSDHLLSMLEPIDEQIALVLQKKFPAVVTSKGFLNLLVGVGFSNDVLERALIVLVNQLSVETAAETYQVLVGQVLLREDGLPMDARVIVEDAKAGVLKYLKSRWMNVRSHNGFDPLENWALKEISDEIGVQVEELLLSTPVSNSPQTKTGLRVTSTPTKDTAKEEKQAISAATLRASVLCRNASRKQSTPPPALSGRVMAKSASPASTTTTSRSHLSSVTNNPLTPTTSPSILSRPRPSITGTQKSPLPTVITTTNSTRRGSENLRSSIKSTINGRRPSVLSNESSASTSSVLSPTRSEREPVSPPHSTQPPLPPIPKPSTPASKRPSTTSRASSPTPSVASVSSKSAGKRAVSVASRSRQLLDLHTKTSNATTDSKQLRVTRTRTLTSTSSASTRSSSSISNRAPAVNGRKTNTKPGSLRKTPSSVSMRSDISTATVGGAAHRRRPSVPSKAEPPVPAVRRKVTTAATPSVTLSVKPPDRLRTTSATARTGVVAAAVRAIQPEPVPKRPSSAASVRMTVAKTNGAGGAKAGPGSSSTTTSTIRAVKTKPKVGGLTTTSAGVRARTISNNSTASAAVTAKNPSSARARTISTNSAAAAGPSNRTAASNTKLASPLVTTRASRARKTSGMSEGGAKASKDAEDPVVVVEGRKADEESGHHSQGSTGSASTVRLGATAQAGSTLQTIIVTPSSSPSIHRIASAATVTPAGPPAPGTPLPGQVLLCGIPCVVSTTTVLADGMIQPVKFRAVVKYLGMTFFGPGEWVGVEVAEREDMPAKNWIDGSVEGVRYFELGQETSESRARLMRNLSATPSAGDRRSPSSMGGASSRLGSPGEVGSLHSLRPSLMGNNLKTVGSDDELSAPCGTRGLFVRPHEVIFVF